MSDDDTPAGRPPSRPWWWPRWWELAPEAVLATGLSLFLIDETDAATSAFKSGRAVALMAVAGIAWFVGRLLLSRLVRWPAARAAMFGIAAAGALAVVVVPAYDDDTVVETFPGVAASAPAGKTPVRPAPVDDAAAVTAPPAPDAASPASTTTSPPIAPPTTTTTTAPSEPVRFRVGAFRGIDHDAEGTVAFYRRPDGRFVVGLEDFDVQPGPDYDVYVVPGTDREDKDGGRRLDDLRGNRGTQYYEVPADLDLADGPWTLLIWCQTFAVPVANSTPV